MNDTATSTPTPTSDALPMAFPQSPRLARVYRSPVPERDDTTALTDASGLLESELQVPKFQTPESHEAAHTATAQSVLNVNEPLGQQASVSSAAARRVHPPHKNGYRLSSLSIGNREVWAMTRRHSFWQDFYHASMLCSWGVFLLWAVVFFLSVNALFSSLYAFDLQGISNIPANQPWFVFFFSVETFATLGYGNMHPTSFYTHAWAMVESFTGLMFSAVMTGLVFARFARPRARIVFAHHAVIGRHEGQLMWMTRVANERRNHINGAQARLWLVRMAVNEEGQRFRKFTELPLRHQSNPLFVLNWTVMHPIDAHSPLRGMTAEDWADQDVSFVLVIEGTDETIAQSINARHTYYHKEVRWYEQFANMFENLPDGRTMINLQRLHDTFEQPYDPEYDSHSVEGAEITGL